MQDEPAVLAHRARNVGDDDERRMHCLVLAEAGEQDVSARPQGGFQRAARIEAAAAIMGPIATSGDPVVGHPHPGDGRPRLRQLGRAHLREVLGSEHLVGRDGQACVEFQYGALVHPPRAGRFQRIRHPPPARLRRRRRLFRGRLRREHREHALHQLTGTPEQPERLFEHRRILPPRHEDGVERPVEVVARADAASPHRLDRRQRIGRSDAQPGTSQRAREMRDIVGEMPAGRHAAACSRRIAFSISSASPWPIRAMSS